MTNEDIKCARHSLVPVSIQGLPWLGSEKSFQNRSSQMAGRCYFEIRFCKYSKYFLQQYLVPTVVQALGPGQTTRFFTRFFTRQKIEEKIEPFGHLVE